MGKKVYVASYHFSDRHGDCDSDIIGVYSTNEKAVKACGDNIESYLRDFNAVRKNNTINPNVVMQIDSEDVPEGMTLEQARKATSINIDDSGTWCNWSIDEKGIE